MSESLNIILNGKIVKGIPGETILELAKRNNIEIPTLCNDPRLKPYTSCFVCVVEVEGMRGLQPSCSTKISEGMKINTHNDRIYKSRQTALELLLSNHYADCIGPCKDTCPAGVDVQGYISYIEKGMYHEAVALIKETNPLPAICGRVCVRPCEVACRRNLLDEGAAVGIDYMKRFVADFDLESNEKYVPEVKEPTGKKVAIIGAGPGGLSAAFFLQKEGHQADIFEASPQAGGWLRYGIPEYRLPNDLLQKEVDNITELGVNIFYNKKLGQDISYKELKKKYDSTILAIGSQKGTLVGCEGDDAENVFSGIDFLKEMEMTGKRYDFSGKTVIVVGGGNTAMDCCRSAKRCGAEKVIVVYRRTEKEMPANPIEIHESKLEGVEYMLLTNPARINKDEDGKVKSMSCLKMQLGEADASGRRRPIPIEGSDFDINADYVLAAIGQKTIVNFMDDINQNTEEGELKTNRWGDIDAKPDTLQTGIASIFAAGDGVTGPATLIQAIGQARIASHSCMLFLNGEEVIPMEKEFLSKKDNFKVQISEDYKGHFNKQEREEMPVLDPKDRLNFKEVELGYANEDVAIHEAQRCLECGCTEYFTCDLKRYSTEYHANQKKHAGEFKEYHVDFRHPFIEIDNNKCILCARCVRICKEVVGANALGLINRGFDTFVAPSMGSSLQETPCESCGLCISTCPTGAITENVPFKPGPVKLDSAETICNYCSVGCSISLKHKNQFIMKVEGSEGMVNKDANLCRYAKFGYRSIKEQKRLEKPLIKDDKGNFNEISFEEAARIISSEIANSRSDDIAFFAGARLSNEEQYQIQKLARAGAKTNNISSFHYLNRGNAYTFDTIDNVPFDQLKDASRIYLIGSEINMDNAVAGFMVHNARMYHGVPVEMITTRDESSMKAKTDKQYHIKSYYHFLKAVNYYLLSNGFENAMYINDNTRGFDNYKEHLLSDNFIDLLHAAGIDRMDEIVEFAKAFNKEMNAVIIFSEKELCSNASFELFNLALLTGKLGKTANGIICLKEKNNAQGLFDMGIAPHLSPGTVFLDNDRIKELEDHWKINGLATESNNVYELLEDNALRKLFIFGEDPLGCAANPAIVENWFKGTSFICVQDYFLTPTCQAADLVLPASMPWETGGSFTNTQKQIQKFDKIFDCPAGNDNLSQLGQLMDELGLNGARNSDEIFLDAAALFPTANEKIKHQFIMTNANNGKRMFHYGCDSLNRTFEEYFEKSFE